MIIDYEGFAKLNDPIRVRNGVDRGFYIFDFAPVSSFIAFRGAKKTAGIFNPSNARPARISISSRRRRRLFFSQKRTYRTIREPVGHAASPFSRVKDRPQPVRSSRDLTLPRGGGFFFLKKISFGEVKKKHILEYNHASASSRESHARCIL